MDVRLIALDMDGTLLDADHATVPERSARALRAAAERGVLVAAATGRPMVFLEGVARQLGGAMRYGVCANGASVWDLSTGERLLSRPLPERQWLQMLAALRDFGLPFEVYCEGDNYVEQRFAQEAGAWSPSPAYDAMFQGHTIFARDLDGVLAGRTVEKIHVFRVPAGLREQLVRRLEQTGPAAVANAVADNLELTAAGVSKGGSLKALCAHLNVPAGAVMAFGDGCNDLEMLSWAGWSFAMENGMAEAKAAAKYAAPANTEGGVGQAVERYVLDGSI